jgi:hypothetical protein
VSPLKGRRHARTCRHCPRVRQLGHEFQAHRAAWEARAETVTAGYATELDDYRRRNPAPTFRTFLLALAGSGWPMSGRQA